MSGGTYTLVLERTTDACIEVGALGERRFPAGWYAYTGSALGTGGFNRVERHQRVAAGENDARHWHVDYLLGDDNTAVDQVVTTDAAIECAVAREIDGPVASGFGRVESFGCSDCDCRSHLAFHERRDKLLHAVSVAHDALRDGAPSASE